MTLTWIYLVVAGLLEIGFAWGLKHCSHAGGVERPWIALVTGLLMLASLYFLSLAQRSLPIGTAYALWTGMGVIGTAALGMFLYDEPRSLLRLCCLALIVVGIVGLKVTSEDYVK